jgi:L-rhamnono-1,4-lactonase
MASSDAPAEFTFEDVPIIDSHIHLFPESELETLFWNYKGHPLWSQHSVTDYLTGVNSPHATITKPNKTLRGFIFLETDRKTDHTSHEAWKTGPLAEIAFLTRIALGKPRAGEGHDESHSKLLLAMIPWAPLPSGPEVLEQYVSMARETAGEAWPLVKGFRYLVQDKPKGTMVQTGFVEGMKWLGSHGFVFDLGIDFRQAGAWQLEEAAEMLEAVSFAKGGDETVKIIVNHMCKPPMHTDATPLNPSPGVEQWKERLAAIAKYPNTILKISGGFSEIQELPKYGSVDDAERAKKLQAASSHIGSFVDVAIDLFGLDRVIFGSDWPVCNMGGGGNEVAWNDWLYVIREWVKRRGLSPADQKAFFAENALRAYNIK